MLVVICVDRGVHIGIAFWARSGSTHEFYVAGGGIHPIANGMATAADWIINTRQQTK
jgi:cation/acetate symporter